MGTGGHGLGGGGAAGGRAHWVPQEQLTALRACSLFQPLSLAQQEHLAGRLVRVAYAPGAAIVREGDPGDGFYLVATGEVRVSQQGRELRRMGPGTSFGEIALLRGIPRTATVEAITAVDAWRLEAPAFLGALAGSSLSRAAAEDVAQRWEAAPTR